MGDVTIVWDEANLNALLNSPAGPVGALTVKVLQEIAQEAKRRAPVGEPSHTPEGHPAGYLRSQIDWRLIGGGGMPAGRVESPAVTSAANPRGPGQPYAYEQETTGAPHWPAHPYLVPAVLDVAARYQ